MYELRKIVAVLKLWYFGIYRKEPKGSFFAAIGGKCVRSVKYRLRLRSVSFFPSAFYDIVAKKQPLPYGGGCAHLPYTLYGFDTEKETICMKMSNRQLFLTIFLLVYLKCIWYNIKYDNFIMPYNTVFRKHTKKWCKSFWRDGIWHNGWWN